MLRTFQRKEQENYDEPHDTPADLEAFSTSKLLLPRVVFTIKQKPELFELLNQLINGLFYQISTIFNSQLLKNSILVGKPQINIFPN